MGGELVKLKMVVEEQVLGQEKSTPLGGGWVAEKTE